MELIIHHWKSGSSCCWRCFSCCWHTSGWNELASWFRLAKQKRKKQQVTQTENHQYHHPKCRLPIDLHYNHSQSAHKSSPSPLPTTRRMKVTKLSTANLSILLIISFICLISPTVVHSQLMVDHPWRDSSRFQQLNHSKSIQRRNRDEQYRAKSHQQELQDNNNDIASYSTLPTSRDKQNELVRRLSSTMLLETLLKNPMPINNKAPFPSLVLPRPLRPPVDPPYSLNIDTSNYQRPYRRRKNGGSKLKNRAASQADALKTNTRNESSKSEEGEEEDKAMKASSLDKFIAESDLFNASSLNYLVEKLLNSTPISKHHEDHHQKPLSLPPSPPPPSPPLSRPTNRKKVVTTQRVASKETGAEHVLPTELQELKTTHQTLDKLIKDEYDTRVKPMFKTLLEQQKTGLLYEPDDRRQKVKTRTKITTISGDNSSVSNHKLDMSSSNFSSSTLSPLDDDLPNQGPSPTVVNVSSSTADDQLVTIIPVEDLIPFAHFDDEFSGDTSDSSDQNSVASRRNATTASDQTPSIKLQNVPPYQLGSGHSAPSARPKPPKLYIPPETGIRYSPTTHPLRFASPSPREVTIQRPKKFHNESLGAEKSVGASVRGSLVFSDGVGEGPGKKRGQSQSNDRRATTASSIRNSSLSSPPPPPPPPPSSSVSRRKESKHSFGADTSSLFDRPKESFLLNQLFSTVNPLRDLDLKLREQYNNRDQTMQHPLVYKGYVGRDDTSFQNGVDWSRPIGQGLGQREMMTTSRYSSPSLISSPAPPTEPPGFYLSNRQPVTTSAQAVPNMFIPTSDPPYLTTTPAPASGGQSRYSIPYPAGGPPPSLFTAPARGAGDGNDELRYSYQLPDRPHAGPAKQNKSGAEFSLPGRSISEVIKLKVLRNETGSGGGRNLSSSLMEDSLNALWSPTKLNNETMSTTTLMKRKEQHDGGNATSVTSSVEVSQQQQHQNSSSTPHMVSIVSSKGTATTVKQHNQTHPPPDEHKSSQPHHQISAQAAHERNRARSRTKNRNQATATASDEQEEGENDEDEPESVNNTRSKTKLGLDNFRRRPPKRPEKDRGDEEEEDLGGNSDGDDGEENVTETAPKKRKKTSGKFARKNQTRSQFESHVEAGSEIQLTGLPGRNHTATTTVNLYKNLPKETGESFHREASSDGSSSAAPATSFGSTIIPTNNFYGEASSESPTLDNPISVLNNNAPGNGNNNKMNRNAASGLTTEDPFQRANQRAMSSTRPTPTLQPSMVADSSVPSPTKPSPAQKSSRDPLAFILIGGSCALSVVCLVLAAMSMRCQDMCDDYRTLRNAERAALKLQKHRLKYTKSHQINRFNSNSNASNGSNNNLIDEMLGEQKRHDDADGFLDAWNSPATAATFLGSKSSDLSCRCGACSGRGQCSCPEEKHISWLHHQCCHQQQPMTRSSNTNNNNRPPFGVGSSVGTFFAASRRPDEHFLAAGGSQDAQLLIDSCQPSSAPGVSRSKSILHSLAAGRSRKMVYPMMGAKSSAVSLDFGPTTAACSNPEHNHHGHQHHHCSQHQQANHHHSHHHHHHQHCARYNNQAESSAGEESKLTLDEESVLHCCEAGAKCHHHRAINASLGLSNRLKLLQLRSAGHHQPWKHSSHHQAAQENRSHHNHHHHHRHHHHPQQQQQVSNSSDSSSLAQCTCSQDSQPLIGSSKRSNQNHHRPPTGHHHHQNKLGQAISSKQAKRDKAAMLVWSTNRDRLI